jgi:hypothetical protein
MDQNRRRKRAMTDFDPALHRMVPQQRWFEDFAPGERFVIPSRTMTSAVFAAFQRAAIPIPSTTMSNIAAPAACLTCSRMDSRR